MADVFISYHMATAGETVRKIATALEQRGLSCWYAEKDTLPGIQFAGVIPQAIRECELFLVVLDEGGNRSRDVWNEIALAYNKCKTQENFLLLPFISDKIKMADTPSYYLATISRLPYTDTLPCVEEIEKLANVIKNIFDHFRASAT